MGAALTAIIEIAFPGFDAPARRSLQIFGLAIIGWTMTALDDVFVGLAAAIAMAIFVTGSPEGLFTALGNRLIWLLVAAFIFAEAFQATRLADLLVSKALGKTRSLRRLFHSLAAVTLASAFVIPSTGGRAAALFPMFTTISAALGTRSRIALALLLPTGILLGAFGSLIGAGAHMVAVEILSATTGNSISFAYWMLLALPLAAITCFLATEVILHMFLNPDERRMPIAPIAAGPTGMTAPRQRVLWVAMLVLVGWITKSWHQTDETLIALVGALIITAPRLGVVRLSDALKTIDWGLLIFLASTVFLADALASSRAADHLLAGPLNALRQTNWPPIAMVGAVAVIGIALHLIVHSRTARVAMLVPPVLLLAAQTELNPVSATMVAVAATGFSQTLMVSAKSLIVFANIEGCTYSQRDLLRLSSVLAPLHLALVLVFAGAVWPWLGTGLSK